MASLFHNIKANLSENREDWYNICQEAESALFRVKNACGDEVATKTLERMILELNNIRMEKYEALTEYALVEESFGGKKITTNLYNDRTNPVWIVGDISIDDTNYRVNAKVFQEPSEFGIDKGPVSKLYIAREDKYKESTAIINYDRGWDIKPTEETEEIYNIALGAVEAYRKDHPYETDPNLKEATSSDTVYVVCYNQIEAWPTRGAAISFYTEGAACCEGAEQNRYISIVRDLQGGTNIAFDGGYEKITSFVIRNNKGDIVKEESIEPIYSDDEDAITDFLLNKGNINESIDVEEEEDYIDPDYDVDIRELNLTNGGYHNNSNAIYGRIKLSPKGDLEPGVYDIIYLPEGEYLYVFKPGTDVKEAVNLLYMNDGFSDNKWVKWNGHRIQIEDINKAIEETSIEPPIEQYNSIMSAISEAYFNNKPIPLKRVNYQ